MDPQLVAKLVIHSAKFWNLLDELHTRAKKYAVCPIYPRPPKSMLITPSGTMVISYLANIVQGGGGMFYLGLGYLKIRQKMVKCVISFATDCSLILGKYQTSKIFTLPTAKY